HGEVVRGGRRAGPRRRSGGPAARAGRGRLAHQGAEEPAGPAAHELSQRGWTHSVIIRSFRCRQVIRSGRPGEAVKPWTSPGGTTTTDPPDASIVSPPARNEPDPSCSSKGQA